ncbi:MAG: hypothetical protein JXO22_16305 [Phycisphaerae bacterium]|nr:hypothetical protein [Phycisphaerae bacterium]
MPRTTSLVVAMVISALLALPTGARADLPDDQYIQYLMHATPADPNSPVVFGVALTLQASDADGDAVGWDVTAVDFTEYDPNGLPDRTWVENNPHVPTADGLWWIEHADGENPEPAEFAEPPLLEGQAAANNFGAEDLDYMLEGLQYSPPPGGAPYTNTAALNHEFTLDGESEPIESGEAEPVEIPPYSDPPTT